MIRNYSTKTKPVRSIRDAQWQICLLLLIALAGLNIVDGLGMIFGELTRTAPEYLFLNGVLSLKIQGSFLLVVSIGHIIGAIKRNLILEFSFIFGATFYSLWAFGVLFSQLVTGEGTIGTLSKTAFLCAVYLLLIRFSPHPHPKGIE